MTDETLTAQEEAAAYLAESVRFVREILTDIARAPLVSYAQRFSHLRSYDRLQELCPNLDDIFIADVDCREDIDDWKENSQDAAGRFLCLHRPEYECTHPAIRDSFKIATRILLEERGLKEQGLHAGGYKTMKPGEFGVGSGVVSMLTLKSPGIAIFAPYDEAQGLVHEIAHADLDNACLRALTESIEDMKAIVRRKPPFTPPALP